MHDIRHRVGIKAPQSRVYEMLSTKHGLAEFWAQVDGESEVGGKLGFFFGTDEPVVVFEVDDLSPNERVHWRCIDGFPGWIGTTVAGISSRSTERRCCCSRTPAGRSQARSCTTRASTKWATFLIGLRSGLEGGEFTAFPDDTLISSTIR